MRTVLSLAVLAACAPALGWELKRDSTGSPVRWAREVRFVVDAGLAERLGAPDAFVAVQRAVDAVNGAAPGLRVQVEAGTVSGVGYDTTPGARNRSEIVAPEVWEYDVTAIAVTVVTLDVRRHEIVDADIAFNVAHRRFRVLPDGSGPGGDSDDIQNTLTHELGHAVGLAHTPEVPEAVMYPGARKGEVTKRHLSEDDVEGLNALYDRPLSGPDASGEEVPMGCAATPGAPSGLWPLLALGLGALARRRGRAPGRAGRGIGAMGALLVAGAAWASEPAALQDAAVVATGEVVSTRTLSPAPGQTLFFTEVEVRVRECVKGACPGTVRLRVPGGRSGDLEQIVAHQPVPRAGEVLAVAEGPGRARLWRLHDPVGFVAFAEALHASGLEARLTPPTRPVSGHTPRSPATPPASR